MRRRRNQRRRFFKVLLFVFLTISVLSTALYVVGKFSSQKTTKVAASPPVKQTLGSNIALHNKKELQQMLQTELAGTTGSYGIIFLNFKTGETYFSEENRVYKSASLYKLWIMATAFEQIKNGKLREDEILSENAATLYEKFKLATDSAELKDKTITLSVKDALEHMIIISDNDAALLLAARVRLANVSDYLKRQGFIESKVGVNDGYPLTTPFEIALFFKKLYRGELTTPEYTEKMLALLKRQRLNEKLPKHLPTDIAVAHKTGELNEFTHDAGIVFTPQGDYLVAVLSESQYPPQAKERVADISKVIYTYFITSQD